MAAHNLRTISYCQGVALHDTLVNVVEIQALVNELSKQQDTVGDRG